MMIAKYFSNLPIQRKLLIVILGTTFAVLALGFTILTVNDVKNLREALQIEAHTHAKLLADYSLAPLVFYDASGCNDVLSRAEDLATVIDIHVYDIEAQLFSRYSRADSQSIEQLPRSLPASWYADNVLHTLVVIEQEQTMVGYLYLRSSMENLNETIRFRILLFIFIVFILMVFATLIAQILQPLITRPIAYLAKTTKVIADSEDFSIRMEGAGDDEIGVLYNAFNSLLARLERREMERDDALSALKQVQRQLEHLNVQLKQSVQEEVAKNRQKDFMLIQQSRLAAMGEMIGNIAHQWRQPICTLSLILSNILDDYECGTLTLDVLEKKVVNGQKLIDKMSTTIDDFRYFFKPERKKSWFSVDKTIIETVSLIHTSFIHYNIHIDYVSPSQIILALGYANETSQVILIILSNAKDAILESKLSYGSVKIRVATTGEYAIVSIQDNGGGIDDRIIDKIFDPYFTTKNDSHGTGIGLYLSKMIIEENMGGRIEVENTPDGAEFRIFLRIQDISL